MRRDMGGKRPYGIPVNFHSDFPYNIEFYPSPDYQAIRKEHVDRVTATFSEPATPDLHFAGKFVIRDYRDGKYDGDFINYIKYKTSQQGLDTAYIKKPDLQHGSGKDPEIYLYVTIDPVPARSNPEKKAPPPPLSEFQKDSIFKP